MLAKFLLTCIQTKLVVHICDKVKKETSPVLHALHAYVCCFLKNFPLCHALTPKTTYTGKTGYRRYHEFIRKRSFFLKTTSYPVSNGFVEVSRDMKTNS